MSRFGYNEESTMGKNQKSAVETDVTTSAATEVAADVQTTAVETVPEVTPAVSETEIEVVEIPAPVVAPVGEVLPAEIVVAETPKPAVVALTPNGTVMDTKIRTTPVVQRIYKLTRWPNPWPKGQRDLICRAINELMKNNKREFTADDLVPFCRANNYSANAGIPASVRWHLHQMTINLKVLVCLNEKQVVEVERGVTPAEAHSEKFVQPTKSVNLLEEILKLKPEDRAALAAILQPEVK